MKKNKIQSIHIVTALAIFAIVLVGMLFVKGFNNSGTINSDFYIEEYGLEITEIASYSGEYVEDGSNENIKNVLSIKVENKSSKPIQYCEIYLEDKNGEKATFKLSTLPANETMLVMESNKRTFKKSDSFKEASASNVAYFQYPISMQEDKIELSGMDGCLNVKNISNGDIKNTVYVYYKNYDKENNLFVGGITYRAKVEGGLKVGEIKQVMTSHFSLEDSMLMFVGVNGE